MKQKKWKVITSVALLAILVVAGFIAIAAEYGTSDDPLVSLSYINNVLSPQISQKVDEIIAEKTKGIEDRINSVSGELDAKLSEYTSKSADEIATEAFVQSVADKVAAKVPASNGSGSTFALVKLNAGQTLTAKVGCEILLRIGDAVCVASGSPGLIDMTTGGDLTGRSALVKNHLYLCTVDGRGVKASNAVTLMVRGNYTVS